MPDEKGNPVRGEEGHWRYNKDIAAGNKFDKKGNLISTGPPEEKQTGKDTSTQTPGIIPKQKPLKKGTPDPAGVYTMEVAKGFNKDEQKNLLKARGIKVISRDTEKSLVAKILDSNPGDEAEDLDVPPEPPAEIAKEKHKYTEIELENFKAKKLVEILKGLGVKRIPLSERGRIKKILETQ